MADVRALLRSERTARRTAHPHATYSASGQLLCVICRVVVKSESLWDAHLTTTQHVSSLAEIKKRPVRDLEPAKKRKAIDEQTHLSKRQCNDQDFSDTSATPPGGVMNGQEHAVDDTVFNGDRLDSVHQGYRGRDATSAVTSQEPSEKTAEVVDEDEWAAFEKDITTTLSESKVSAFAAPATIHAAPLTTPAPDADSSGMQNTSRDHRLAESEADKEEATRQLEDELDEMEVLEQRVRRLRDRREALRATRDASLSVNSAAANSVVSARMPTESAVRPASASGDESSEEEDQEDFGVWHVNRSDIQ